MTTALEQLGRTPDNIHRQTVVSLATRVLFFRSSSQIHELMEYSSTAIKQRWEFLQPSINQDSKQTPQEILTQADGALQWTKDSDIGDIIRNSHFALELTEQQQETLCSSNVRFRLSDINTFHALAPFAVVGESSFVVDLVWENERWVYFDTLRVSGCFPQSVNDVSLAAEISDTIVGAATAFDSCGRADVKSDVSDDDSYWNQFPQSDVNPPAVVTQKQTPETDDYWAMYDNPGNNNDEDPPAQAVPDNAPSKASDASRLVSESVRHALAAAAAAARAVKMSEADFLQLALAEYSQTN
ncbi:hypothetical protein H4R24_005612 [Coemansia sp. RSA 988]|nr:hypothetical protein H4R24_005612 [Coemansia sp. RSA 988]